MNDRKNLAGLVLCGGQSRRMGQAKYRLAYFGETLLRRICRIVTAEASPILVVAAADQDLALDDFPPAAPNIQILRDDVPNSGPLAGIAQGLKQHCEMPQSPGAVFVTSCDVPLLKPELIQLLRSLLTDEFEAVVIRDGQFSYPLCAVYRASAAIAATSLLNAGERRARALPEALCTRWVTLDEVRSVDPELESLRNCNTPDDYEQLIHSKPASLLLRPHDQQVGVIRHDPEHD